MLSIVCHRRGDCFLLFLVLFVLGDSNVCNALSTLGKKSTAQQVLSHLKQTNQLAPYAIGSSNGGKTGTVVVTGGSSGIGAETVKVLAQGTGMNVVLCARDVQSAQEFVDDSNIFTNEQQGRIFVQYMDLSKLQSVKDATQNIIEQFQSVDCIINNAGIMSLPKRETTVDGIEMQFGTNHIGHFYFTRLLLPHLNEENGGGRVVTVASSAHQLALSTTDWQSDQSYTPFGSYGTSKLANILFGKSLHELSNKKVTSVSLHPGVISSPLWKHTLPNFLLPAVNLIANKSIEQGAATNVYCALARYVEGGGYFEDCRLGTPNKAATSVSNRNALWEYSENLLKEMGYDLPEMSSSSVINVVDDLQTTE